MKKNQELFAILFLYANWHTPLVSSWKPSHGIENPKAGYRRRQFLINGVGSALSGGILLVGNSHKVEADDKTGIESSLSDLSTFSHGPGGILYRIVRPGEGDPPIRAQQVRTKYTLWTSGFGEDGGTQVDSNTGFLGRPLSVIVGVGRVIKGWDLTLLDMKPGEIRRIVVPSDLGYGDRGAGGAIPPNATLYFEVELVEVDPMIQLNDQQKKWLEDNPL
jgi:peptidylprolyl isomerase